MDYDQLALFLASCTSPGFRRSLRFSPQDTLMKCGFTAGEAGLLAQSLNKKGSNRYDITSVQRAFNPIEIGHKSKKGDFADDWIAVP